MNGDLFTIRYMYSNDINASIIMIFLFLSFSCIYVEPSLDWYWSGNVYLRGSEGLENTEDIDASMTYPTGRFLQEAKTPNGQNSPYRRFEFDENQYDMPVNIRVNGVNGYSTLWSARTPTHSNPTGGENDIWLNGALYIQGQAFQQTFLNSLGLVDVPLLIDPETSETQTFAHLWGQPLDPTVWAGAHIEVLVIESDLESIIFDTGTSDNTGTENVDILESDELDWSNATTHDDAG